MSQWLAAHLSWLVWALLALWAPPLLFTIGVDLGLITEAASGFLALSDPSVILSAIQIVLMAAALPGLPSHRNSAWRLLAAAVVTWSIHLAWGILVRVRLLGAADLASSETVSALVGVLGAGVVLLMVRAQFVTTRIARMPRISR